MSPGHPCRGGEAGHLRRFAEAIGDHNPRWLEEAPPTFLVALAPTSYHLPEAEEYGKGWLNGGNRFEYLEPVRVGDRITATGKVADVYEKSGGSGTLLFIIFDRLCEPAWRTVARSGAGRPSGDERAVGEEIPGSSSTDHAAAVQYRARKATSTRSTTTRTSLAASAPGRHPPRPSRPPSSTADHRLPGEGERSRPRSQLHGTDAGQAVPVPRCDQEGRGDRAELEVWGEDPGRRTTVGRPPSR